VKTRACDGLIRLRLQASRLRDRHFVNVMPFLPRRRFESLAVINWRPAAIKFCGIANDLDCRRHIARRKSNLYSVAKVLAQLFMLSNKRWVTRIAATVNVSLCMRMKKLTAFIELESATRLLERECASH